MKLNVALDNGFLPDRYGKYAPAHCKAEGHPIVSFPIEISETPENAKSLSLVFVDFDAIPVGGFCWIHWLACNIDPSTTLIPDNASESGELSMVQGSNSSWSPFIGGARDSKASRRYTGPYPPDKDHVYTLHVYALDTNLALAEGYYLNEFRRAIQGHVLERVTLEIPSRS